VETEELGATLDVGEPDREVALVEDQVAGLLVQAQAHLELGDGVGLLLDLLAEQVVVDHVVVVVEAAHEVLVPAEQHQLQAQEPVHVLEVGVVGELGLREVLVLGVVEVALLSLGPDEQLFARAELDEESLGAAAVLFLVTFAWDVAVGGHESTIGSNACKWCITFRALWHG
jgi:hypothetical protein